MKLLLLFIGFSFSVTAQIGMQQWRIHFSAFEAINVIKANNTIFMAAKNGIIEYDLVGNEISTLTVTNGLSDKGISAIAGNDDIIFIGYSNGNLDIIKDNEIINIPWLKRALISGNKSVNNILIQNNIAYLSTGAGLLVFNINKLEISSTYLPKIGVNIFDAAIFNDSIYLGTSEGLYYADLNNQFLNNSSNWYKKSNFPLHIQNGKINEIETYNDFLFISYDVNTFQGDSLYKLSLNNELSLFFDKSITIKRLSVSEDLLIISRYSNTMTFDKNLVKHKKNIFDYSFGSAPNPSGAISFNDELWIADNNNGLVRATDPFSRSSQVYANSPFTDKCYRLDIKKNKVAIAGGGLTGNLKNTYSRSGGYVFENGSWLNINKKTNPQEFVDSLNWDFISVSINPKNTNQVAFASYSKGGLKILENENIIGEYTEDNSPIESQVNSPGVQIISDLQYDKNGNLWVANSGINPLKVLTKDGVWHAYNLGSSVQNKYLYRLFIDSKGYKWVAVHQVGILVYDDNGTIEDISDDRKVLITTSKGFGNLPSSEVKSIFEDIDGEIWVGTTDGIGVFYNTSTIFDGGFGDADANTVVIYDEEKEEYVPIFDKVTVSALIIDGGNRKWIGTTASGVFCMSENGKDEIYHFDANNSPLISNTILDIKINYESGEIFIATDEGLISYKADVTAGDNSFSDVTVYPNPVRPGYSGMITIEGVGYKSQVRITDISGNLVYSTESNGGSIIWDGNRLTGERVQSGVYLVWSALTKGKGKNVAKILIIN